MKFLEIKSKGEIEQSAFTLIGASSKRGDDTKIGYFGSGLKYSISYLIRSGIQFKIFSGVSEVKIHTEPETFRGEQYNVIYVNGSKTSLTDTMGGVDWETPYVAFREIYSNALDEDSKTSLRVYDHTIPTQGYTSFFLEYTPEVQNMFENFEAYFSMPRPKLASVTLGDEGMSIMSKLTPERAIIDITSTITGSTKSTEGCNVFRAGILSYSSAAKSVFDYNMKPSSNIRVNESRVLKSKSDANKVIFQLWHRLPLIYFKELIMALQGGNKGYYEHVIIDSYYGFYGKVEPTEEITMYLLSSKFVPVEYVMVLGDKVTQQHIQLPLKLLKRWHEVLPGIEILGLTDDPDNDYEIVDNPPSMLVDNVRMAIEHMSKFNLCYDIAKYRVKYAIFMDTNTLAQAINESNNPGTILLSTKLSSYNVGELIPILFEEYTHLEHGLHDETRSMQTHLFKQVIVLEEQLLRNKNTSKQFLDLDNLTQN